MVTKSLCASLISPTENYSHEYSQSGKKPRLKAHSMQAKGVHIPFSKDSLLTESEACLLTGTTGKNGSQT